MQTHIEADCLAVMRYVVNVVLVDARLCSVGYLTIRSGVLIMLYCLTMCLAVCVGFWWMFDSCSRFLIMSEGARLRFARFFSLRSVHI